MPDLLERKPQVAEFVRLDSIGYHDDKMPGRVRAALPCGVFDANEPAIS